VIEFGYESMLEPIHKCFREKNSNKWIRYRPKDVIPSEPPKALGQREPSREVELRTAEFDEVAKCDNEKHQEKTVYSFDIPAQCQKSVVVRVDRNVEGNSLIDHHEGVHD